MFITPAWADTANSAASVASGLLPASQQGPGFLVTIIPLLLVFIVFYVMVIMPQNKRISSHRKMIGNLQKGDKVVTGGGIIATVKKLVGEEDVILEIASGVEVLTLRHTIMTVRESGHLKAIEKAQQRDDAKDKNSGKK
jgi:preprotein translocase subunit YajC